MLQDRITQYQEPLVVGFVAQPSLVPFLLACLDIEMLAEDEALLGIPCVHPGLQLPIVRQQCRRTDMTGTMSSHRNLLACPRDASKGLRRNI